MLLSHAHRFIFIKSKKAAGTSLEIHLSQYLNDASDIITPITPEDEKLRPGIRPKNHSKGGQRLFWNHSAAADIAARLPEDIWNGYRKITSDRHPYEKAISLAWFHFPESGESDFNAYLDRVIDKGDYKNIQRYSLNGKIVADTIIRYETLIEDTNRLLTSLHLPTVTALPAAKRRFRQDKRPAADILSPQQKQRIRAICAPEFDFFGCGTLAKPLRMRYETDMSLRLGINIDHVATLRNARGGDHPCPIRAAQIAKEAGADGITAHLREDRRHINDRDVERLMKEVGLPLNLEIAMTDEMLAIALRLKPHAVCIVPEKRQELTTEGGLDVARMEKKLTQFVNKLQDNGSRVSLFIDPFQAQIEAAHRTSAKVIELHTGAYAKAFHADAESKDTRKQASFVYFSADFGHSLGLEIHAGHGLNYANVGPIAAILPIAELNIGHFLVGEAVFVGLDETIHHMRAAMEKARA